MAEFKPTEEQEAVVAAARGRDSLMIRAYAGCAKTSTLELTAKVIAVPAMAVAFNKKIAVEMGKRLPGNFKSVTMNGLGHGAWMRANPQVQMKLDDRKLGKLVSEVAKDRGVKIDSEQWDQLRKLAAGVMQAGIVPQGHGPQGLTADTPEAWEEVADGQGLDEDDLHFLKDLAREVVERDIALARAGIISFDDQIYCSALLGGKFPKYPVVFVDESQDLSPLNHRMLAESMRPDTKLVAVGDSRQAIYAWRGADGNSMEKVATLRQDWTNLPLNITFRCPKRVVARQQAHAPGFTAWFTNADGLFHQFQGKSDDESAEGGGWTWGDLERRLPRPEATMAVLCRNNAPLMSLALKLLRRNIGCVFLGRDIGKSLITFTRKLFPNDNTPLDQMLGLLDEWEQGETSKALANKREDKVGGIVDKADSLRAVCQGADVRDAEQLREALQKLFSREEGLVTLSSIHKAKGLEWDLVVHLDPWRIPSKWARAAAKAGQPVPLEQDWNLLYVAETRTKHTLINANLEDFQ